MKKFFIEVFDKILVLDRHVLWTAQFMQVVWQIVMISAGSLELGKLVMALQADY